MTLPPYIILNKEVGETPLEVLENWRQGTPEASRVPLAYAGRLDPMAEGKLLVLIGDECKAQTNYHHLDKEYKITVAFGLHSDSGDVLGIVKEGPRVDITKNNLTDVLLGMVGLIHFPYPIFSAKTVKGKPLHTWAVEGRLSEITIPTRTSSIYQMALTGLRETSRADLVESAITKINILPKVTDPKKALGNDFRRPDVLASWDNFNKAGSALDKFFLADITVICSSGTYMRTLSEVIAEKLSTKGLALAIKRTEIGNFDQKLSIWSKVY